MLKSFFLKRRIKSKKALELPISYVKARKFGVIYNAEEFDLDVIDNLCKTLKDDGKFVAKVGFCKNSKDSKCASKYMFSPKDISTFGKIQKHEIEYFANQNFDYLISLNLSYNLSFKYVLATSKAACKVGLAAKPYEELLLMMLKPEKENLQTTDGLIYYLKMI